MGIKGTRATRSKPSLQTAFCFVDAVLQIVQSLQVLKIRGLGPFYLHVRILGFRVT